MNLAIRTGMTGKLWRLACGLALARVLDPLALVEPVVSISAAERERLDRGELVSRVLPAHKSQVAVFASTRSAIDPADLIDAARDITDLRKSSYVRAVGRFSDPPRLSDLDGLTLDDHDRDVLAACDIGRCSFKLSGIEIEMIK